METSKVVLLDLRDAPADQPTELAGGVVVLDNADTLVKHAETYLALVGEDMVTAVVCVAIGEPKSATPLDGVVLTMPPALRHATVLWIGDPRGVDWAPETSPPRPADNPQDALDDLLAALQVPAVFDRVVAQAEELPSAAANPGIRLVSSAAEAIELAEARAAAIRSLCATDQPPSQKFGVAVRQLDSSHDIHGAVLSGPVGAARTDAVRRLHQVADLARVLGTWKALLGPRRPTEQLGNLVTWAGQAAEKYRRYLAELLNRMDGQLQAGIPPMDKVTELGVQDPREARTGEIAEGLRHATDDRLDDGASLSVLAQELRLAAATSGPQGCAAALQEVHRRGPLALDMPPFPRWPIALAELPLTVLSCAALAFLLGPGWPGWVSAGLLATAWFGSGWLLLGRRPGPQTEAGLGATVGRAASVYGAAAVLGAATGAVGAELPVGQVRVPMLTSQLLIIGAILVSVATVALSWRSAAHRWRARLPVAELMSTLAELTRLTEEATAREWQPMRRRRAIATAATEVAGAIEEIIHTLDESGNRLFVAPRSTPAPDGQPPIIRPAPQELSDVVRGDLVEVCRGALELAWPAAETGRRTAPGVYAQRLDRLLGEYGGHVRRHGLLAAPPLNRDLAPRDALVARIWSETPAALAALRTGVDGDMTQLCRGGQLGYLSTVSEPGLIRFAPQQLRRVLDGDGAHRGLTRDPGIVWSGGGELVGALRLVPLRPESVRQVLGGGL
jgi:hypothetical protein